ncbi:MAG: glycosyltransferase family 2 protein [Candidatus Sumerlaeaceae bacterium]
MHNHDKPPLLSVLLPVRNAEPTLGEAIASVLNQTWSHFELVVINDSSTDGSDRVARAWQQRDSRVNVVDNKGQGIIEALQTGLSVARGDFIARMDADDRALPQRFAKQMELIERDPRCSVCATHVSDIGDVGQGRQRYTQWLNSVRTHDDVVRNLFIECPVAHPTLIIRRRALEHVGGYRDVPWPEDYDLILRLWLAGARFAVVAEPLVEWGDSPSRLSRTDPRYSPEAFRQCKLHYLPLAPYFRPGRELIQWGAGKEGKWWLKHLPPPMRPTVVVDIDPRKVGQRIHGTPVIAPESLGSPRSRFLLIAVGVHGAREEIRPFLSLRGWRELDDYLFLC